MLKLFQGTAKTTWHGVHMHRMCTPVLCCVLHPWHGEFVDAQEKPRNRDCNLPVHTAGLRAKLDKPLDKFQITAAAQEKEKMLGLGL